MAVRFRWPHWLEHNPLLWSRTDRAFEYRNKLLKASLNIGVPVVSFGNREPWFDTQPVPLRCPNAKDRNDRCPSISGDADRSLRERRLPPEELDCRATAEKVTVG